MIATVLEPPFDHGVASFDPTADSVVLWTRAPGVDRVRWCVAPAEGGIPTWIPRDFDSLVAASSGGAA